MIAYNNNNMRNPLPTSFITGLLILLLLYAITRCLATAPCLYDFWHCHPYVVQHFNENVFTLVIITSVFLQCSPLFVHGENSHKDCLVVIQCDSGHINSDLIACARYHVSDMRAKANKLDKANKPDDFNFVTHVLFIIHLPVQAAQSSFVGFQSEPWVSYHIDELRDSDHGHIIPEEAQKTSISELFYGAQQPNMKGADIYKQCVRLNSCIQAAASQLHDSTWNKHRAAKRVELLIKAIPHDPKFPLGMCWF